MLKDLLTIFDVDDDTDVWASCSRIDIGEDSLVLDLDVQIDYSANNTQKWCLTCSKVHENRGDFRGDKIELRDADPLLMPYHSGRASLSFHGVPDDVDAVIGALWQTHHRQFGDCIPFGRFLNGYPLEELLSGGFGQLADGPSPLIQKFDEVLRSHKIDTHVNLWDTNPYARPEAMLLVIGSGFIIAESFDAVRVED